MESPIESLMERLIESQIEDLIESPIESLIESQIESNSTQYLQESHFGWSHISSGIFGQIEVLSFCKFRSREIFISCADFKLTSIGKRSNRLLAALYTCIRMQHIVCFPWISISDTPHSHSYSAYRHLTVGLWKHLVMDSLCVDYQGTDLVLCILIGSFNWKNRYQDIWWTYWALDIWTYPLIFPCNGNR